MSFIIKITEKKASTVRRTEWVKLADSGNEKDGKALYGYGPPIESPTTVERDVLTQEVGELDLAAVIKAVNKL